MLSILSKVKNKFSRKNNKIMKIILHELKYEDLIEVSCLKDLNIEEIDELNYAQVENFREHEKVQEFHKYIN